MMRFSYFSGNVLSWGICHGPWNTGIFRIDRFYVIICKTSGSFSSEEKLCSQLEEIKLRFSEKSQIERTWPQWINLQMIVRTKHGLEKVSISWKPLVPVYGQRCFERISLHVKDNSIWFYTYKAVLNRLYSIAKRVSHFLWERPRTSFTHVNFSDILTVQRRCCAAYWRKPTVIV